MELQHMQFKYCPKYDTVRADRTKFAPANKRCYNKIKVSCPCD